MQKHRKFALCSLIKLLSAPTQLSFKVHNNDLDTLCYALVKGCKLVFCVFPLHCWNSKMLA